MRYNNDNLKQLVYEFLTHVVECSYDCYESEDYTGLEIFKSYAQTDIDFYLFHICYDIEGNVNPVEAMINFGKLSQDLQPYVEKYSDKYCNYKWLTDDSDKLQSLAILYDNLVGAACNEVMEKVWKNLGYNDIEESLGKIPFTDKILNIIDAEIPKVIDDFRFFE